jgi:hypothetical protein
MQVGYRNEPERDEKVGFQDYCKVLCRILHIKPIASVLHGKKPMKSMFGRWHECDGIDNNDKSGIT